MEDESTHYAHIDDWFKLRSPLQKMRWAQKNFHEDAGNPRYEPAENALTVQHVLNSIRGLRDLQEWPAEYADENAKIRVTFPGDGDTKARTIFLPESPKDFYDILAKFKQTGKITPGEHPFVGLNTKDGTRTEEVEESEEHPMAREVSKLILRVRKTEKIPDLTKLYTQLEIHKAFPIELLAACKISGTDEVASITEEISARAKTLFMRARRFTTTPDKLALFAKNVAEFYFLKATRTQESQGNYEFVWDEEVRNEMIQLVLDTYMQRLQKAKKRDLDTYAATFPDKPVLSEVRNEILREVERLKQ